MSRALCSDGCPWVGTMTIKVLQYNSNTHYDLFVKTIGRALRKLPDVDYELVKPETGVFQSDHEMLEKRISAGADVLLVHTGVDWYPIVVDNYPGMFPKLRIALTSPDLETYEDVVHTVRVLSLEDVEGIVKFVLASDKTPQTKQP
jgi:hypothetical protein